MVEHADRALAGVQLFSGGTDGGTVEREGAHRFVTEVVEAFPGEVEALSVSKPALEDVFIRRTGHKFWSEKDQEAESASEHPRR